MATINLRRAPLYGFLVDMLIGRQGALRSIALYMFVQLDTASTTGVWLRNEQ